MHKKKHYKIIRIIILQLFEKVILDNIVRMDDVYHKLTDN
jgi:hypothetical protein